MSDGRAIDGSGGRNTRALIIATSGGAIAFAEPMAARWLREYFPRPPQRGMLPTKLGRWLHSLAAGCPGKSLVVRGADWRLIVSRQRSISSASIVLILHLLKGKTPEGARRHGALTRREAEVVYWVGESKSNDEIALILGRSRGTVRKHLERAYEKLGVENRTAAAAVLRVASYNSNAQQNRRGETSATRPARKA